MKAILTHKKRLEKWLLIERMNASYLQMFYSMDEFDKVSLW